MFRYLVLKSTGMLLTKLARDPHPDWTSSTEYLIEVEDDIPMDEVRFWTWNGSSLSVHELDRYKYRCLKSANKWMVNRLPTVNWGSLSELEKKYIMRAKLTSQDTDELLILWAAAGSPEV